MVPPSSLLETAIKYAEAIVANSPDAVQSTKRGLINSLQHGSVEEAFTAHAWSYETKKACDCYISTYTIDSLRYRLMQEKTSKRD